MIWFIAANAIACRIFEYDKHAEKLTLINEINHPENRLKKEEFLTSDKPGHYKSGTSRGAYEPRTDPKEVEIDNFARQIATELNQGRNAAAYKKLIIMTTPEMEGLLFRHVDKHVKEMIRNTIQKDPQHLKEHELVGFLKVHAEFPDEV
jgi:protein required for attachment to host cells